MRRLRRWNGDKRSLAIGSTIAVLIAALAGLLLAGVNSNRSESVATKRISVSEVRLSNLNAFAAQVRREVPLGTPKREVEVYLSKQHIRCGFAEPDPDISDPNIQSVFAGTIQNIGTRWGFPASLAIRIHLNGMDKVDKIWFRVDYDAP
jgi:hypothetical protein